MKFMHLKNCLENQTGSETLEMWMWHTEMSLFIVKWKPTSSLRMLKLFGIVTKSQWRTSSKIQGINSSEHSEGKEEWESIHKQSLSDRIATKPGSTSTIQKSISSPT